MANADSIEIAILPIAIASAITRLFHIICPTGAFDPAVLPCSSTAP